MHSESCARFALRNFSFFVCGRALITQIRYFVYFSFAHLHCSSLTRERYRLYSFQEAACSRCFFYTNPVATRAQNSADSSPSLRKLRQQVIPITTNCQYAQKYARQPVTTTTTGAEMCSDLHELKHSKHETMPRTQQHQKSDDTCRHWAVRTPRKSTGN